MAKMTSFAEYKRAQKKKASARFLCLNSMLGHDKAIFHVITGSRDTGKSYGVTKRMCQLKQRMKDNCKAYWLRISETSTKNLLLNKADKLVDPDLKRDFDLDLSTKGGEVFNKGKSFCSVYPLSAFGKLKGVGFFDKNFKGKYMIILDEFQLEASEKRTSFDILETFIGMVENFCRNRKDGVEVWLLANNVSEASTIMKAFNFIPETFGRFKIYKRGKNKKTGKPYSYLYCIIDNMQPTEEYLEDIEFSMAGLLGGNKLANYTNELKKDLKVIDKRRLIMPTHIIKFSKLENRWFTIWDGCIIKRYKNESVKECFDINMYPHIGIYNKETKQAVIDKYNEQSFKFHDLSTQAFFADEMKLLYKV